MKILIDDTGEFNLKNKNDFALITLVMILEQEETIFLKKLKELQKGSNVTVKGKNIQFKDRIKLLQYLKDNPFVKYTSIIMESNYGSDKVINNFKAGQINKIIKSIELPKSIGNKSLVKDLELFKNQINNLSKPDFIKFIMIVSLLIEWQTIFLYDYIKYPIQGDSWKITFIIDTLGKPNKMKRILKDFIYLTTNNRNPNYAVFLPKELEKNHPFFKEYDTTNGFNGKKFYSDFSFNTEESVSLLKIPDIIGNTIYRALKHPENFVYVETLKILKNNRSILLTFKNKKNYYTIYGFGTKNIQIKHNRNLTILYKNLNFSLFQL